MRVRFTQIRILTCLKFFRELYWTGDRVLLCCRTTLPMLGWKTRDRKGGKGEMCLHHMEVLGHIVPIRSTHRAAGPVREKVPAGKKAGRMADVKMRLCMLNLHCDNKSGCGEKKHVGMRRTMKANERV